MSGIKLDKEIQRLRDENRDLKAKNRLLLRQENSFEDIITSKVKKFQFDKIHHNYTNREKRLKDGTCLFLSDLHINKIVKKSVVLTNEYNLKIMHKRIEKVIGEMVDYRYKTKNIDIFLGGDILDGIIHNGNITGEVSIVESIEVMYNVLMNIINVARKNFKEIRLHCVMGNHSRITENVLFSNRKHEDFETIVYNMIRREIQKFKHCSIDVSESGYLMTEINGKNIVMLHGDQDRTFKSDMRSASILQAKMVNLFKKPFNHVLVGHFHHAKTSDSGYDGKIIQNSSMIGADEYAVQNPFSLGSASQTLFYVNENGDIENVHQFMVEQ